MGGRHYSEAFRERMIERMLAPGAPTGVALTAETGVSGTTLSRWKAEASTVGFVAKRKKPKVPPPAPEAVEMPERHARSTRQWSPVEKLRVVSEAAQLKDEALGEFLRREGLHTAQLDAWREEILVALGQASAPRRDPNVQRVAELEGELHRKDKALAEVTALLVLRKKLHALFGENSAEEGDGTDEKYGKK